MFSIGTKEHMMFTVLFRLNRVSEGVVYTAKELAARYNRLTPAEIQRALP